MREITKIEAIVRIRKRRTTMTGTRSGREGSAIEGTRRGTAKRVRTAVVARSAHV